MMAEMNVAMTAARHVPCVSTRAPTPTIVPTTVGPRSDPGRCPAQSLPDEPAAYGHPTPDHQESHHDHDQRHQLRRSGLGHPRVIADQ